MDIGWTVVRVSSVELAQSDAPPKQRSRQYLNAAQQRRLNLSGRTSARLPATILFSAASGGSGDRSSNGELVKQTCV
jgi:hypothetical protein